MSDTPSRSKRPWVEPVWLVWIAINVVATILVPAGTTVPFHNIWLSLAVVYGIRLWPVRKTMWILFGICLVGGFALVAALLRSGQGLDEAAEVPMMAGLFVAMVWFATRWQQAVEQLGRASARERDFVRDASHQLRTPITVARGHAELLRDAFDPQTVEEDIDVILGELDRLARISDRLLILATADRVRFAGRAPVNLSHVVGAAMHRWRTAARRDWRLDVRARGTVMGDRERLENALDALIDNAIKATEDGDRIAVRLRAEGDVAVIEVVDSGTGIAPEDLDRVFDRFWRAEEESGRGSGGTGLGLAIVKTIADAHGGTAEASSNGVGGATFRIRLPGYAPIAWPPAKSAASRAGRVSPDLSHRMTV
jgi:two-component system, OmpR family, sensor kinase